MTDDQKKLLENWRKHLYSSEFITKSYSVTNDFTVELSMTFNDNYSFFTTSYISSLDDLDGLVNRTERNFFKDIEANALVGDIWRNVEISLPDVRSPLIVCCAMPINIGSEKSYMRYTFHKGHSNGPERINIYGPSPILFELSRGNATIRFWDYDIQSSS